MFSTDMRIHASQYIRLISEGGFDAAFKTLYTDILSARSRYVKAAEAFISIYGDREARIFSVPGRCEIIGNHTDHNRGCVLAGAVDLDVIAIAAENHGDMAHIIRIKSEGFEPDEIDTRETGIREDERFNSAALIRGVSAGFAARGYKYGGFDAYTSSGVIKGSGLSSSAAFEVLIGHIINVLFNGGVISPTETAQIGQFSENIYFGKPCGLMDQLACATGGVIAIDLNDPDNPAVYKHNLNLGEQGYCLCVVNTHGSHDTLGDQYAMITEEMGSVAQHFGQQHLRGVPAEEFYAAIPALRGEYGDRALLRAIHFFAENERVQRFLTPDSAFNIGELTAVIRESGDSSYKFLQNIYNPSDKKDQGLALAIAVSEQYFKGKNAAVRVHGGGFAGTVLSLLESRYAAEYAAVMDRIFGEGSAIILNIREAGAIVL